MTEPRPEKAGLFCAWGERWLRRRHAGAHWQAGPTVEWAALVTTPREVECLRSRAAYYRGEAARVQGRAQLIYCRALASHLECEAAELECVLQSSPKQNVQLPPAQRQTGAPPDYGEW